MGAALAAAPSLGRSLRAAQRPATDQDGGTMLPASRVPVNATHHILLRGGTIITMDPAVGDFAKGDIHIQGKYIVEVGRDLNVPAGAKVIDAAGTIHLPGFVDCHRHSWSAQVRRMIPDGLINNYMATTHHADGISSELVEAFAKEKLLGPDFTFNHASGLTDAAWRLVREAGCNVDVCTRSDAQYGLGSGASAGVGGFQKALEFGVQPGFSVDNETSYSTDMFGEMRAAFFVQRAFATNRRVNKDPDAPAPVTVRQVLQCATVNGARCAALLDKIGTLTPGKEADVLMIRADEMNVYPLNNALGTVVQAAEVHNVDTVIIGGAIRKRHGALVGINIRRFRQLVDESRSYLFAKMNYKLDILS